MSQRPKFWIHRTKRFWWGLVILLLLQGVWILASYRGASAYFDSAWWNRGGLTVERGGLNFFLSWTDPAPPFSSYVWRFGGAPGGIQLEPEFSWKTQPWGPMGKDLLQVDIFLPGWIPVLIWLPWWLLRMRRADKVEEVIAGKAQVIQEDGQDPA